MSDSISYSKNNSSEKLYPNNSDFFFDGKEFEGFELRFHKRLKPGKSDIETLGDLYDVLTHCWRADTAYPSCQADWYEGCLSWGQCAITAMLVYDMFGGEIYRTPDHTHYYNKIEGHWVDLTARQFWDFGDACNYDAGEKIERRNLGQSGHTKARYLKLVQNIKEYVEREKE